MGWSSNGPDSAEVLIQRHVLQYGSTSHVALAAQSSDSALLTSAGVRDLFPNGMALLANRFGCTLMQHFSRRKLLSNMHVDRELAASKRCAGVQVPDVEHVDSSGHLRTWLALHLKAVRTDPTCSIWGYLLDEGIPLQAGKGRKRQRADPHLQCTNAHVARMMADLERDGGRISKSYT